MTHKRGLLFALLISVGLVSNVQAAHCVSWFSALDVKQKVGVVLFGGALARMTMKAEQERRSTLTEDVRWLKRNSRNMLSRNYIKRLNSAIINFIDNSLIGSSGNKGGMRVEGTKVVWSGRQRMQLNGQYVRDDMPPYGLMGQSFLYLKLIFANLKSVKEAGDTLTWCGDQFN